MEEHSKSKLTTCKFTATINDVAMKSLPEDPSYLAPTCMAKPPGTLGPGLRRTFRFQASSSLPGDLAVVW